MTHLIKGEINNAPFDLQAEDYDRKGRSNPGVRYIREEFQRRILKQLDPSSKIHALDLGCGTGEDALYFGEMGWEVVGIDQSSRMIQVAQGKIPGSRAGQIQFRVEDINNISPRSFSHGRFEVIYSNFGALNCVGDLDGLASCLALFLAVDGLVAINVMGKFHPREILTFGLKGEWKTAFRRFMNKPVAKVETIEFPVQYWNPDQFINLFKKNRFQSIGYSSLAWWVPPPYYFEGRSQPEFSEFHRSVDRKLGSVFPFKHWGDHTLYFFRKER